jgi:hypothetical protein
MSNLSNQEYIPQSTKDLYLAYFLPTDGIVQMTIRSRSRGKIAGDDVLDLAHTVIAKFVQYDLLNRYDKAKATSFKSFLYNIVCTSTYDELKRLAKTDDSIDVTADIVISDEDEGTRTSRHLMAVDAVQETKVEWNETISAMEEVCKRAGRLNRHKRDKSLRTVLAMVRDNATLDHIAASIGVSIATVRNYIGYIAHGADAELNGTGASFAQESTVRPDVKREMSTRAICKLIAAKGKNVAFSDQNGAISYPQFVVNKRGWDFVTMGTEEEYDLRDFTSDSRGFKLHKPDGSVIKVRHFEETADFLIVSESRPTEADME